MTTNNVLVLRTGTGWTVDVTACNLDTNLTVKDFVVLHGGTVVSNLPYAKTTSTTLTYSGVSLPANTQVEVRRRTPASAITVVRLGSRVRSDEWNGEFGRLYRKLEEYDLNGAGSPVSAPIPIDEAFGVSWDADVTYPPTRNSVYDWGITRAPLVSPSFTGNPKAPTASTSDNTTSIATTEFVQANLGNYATLASPSFTGNPTAATQITTDVSTRLATTAYVDNRITNRFTNPTFAGTPTAPSPAITDNSTRIATTQSIATRTRVYAENPGLSATTFFTINIFNNWTELIDENGDFNAATGLWTCPTTGIWSVSLFVPIAATGVTNYGVNYFYGIRNFTGGVNDTSEIEQLPATAGNRDFANPITVTKRFIGGNQYSFYCYLEATGGSMAVSTSYGARYLSIEYKRP